MNQPAILRRRVVRLGIGVAVIGVLAYVFATVVRGTKSADPGNFDSAGYIAATMAVGDGEQAVLINPSGDIVSSPGFTEGSTDQAPTWAPDGQRVYFASDRDNAESHLFRWNPARELVERRTIDKRTKTWVAFNEPADSSLPVALVGSGGTVVAVEPRVPNTRQLMPPKDRPEEKELTESGAAGLFERIYQMVGTTVKKAMWTKDRTFIIAIMRREEGEILVAQKLKAADRAADPTDAFRLDLEVIPILVATGDRIDFDYNRQTDQIVYTCFNFQFPAPEMVPPELKKDGKINLPFRHIIGLYKPGDPGLYQQGPTHQNFMALSKEDTFCFGTPRVSPDGSEALCLVGKYLGSGVIDEPMMVVMKAEPNGGNASRTLVPKGVMEMSWHPNGQSLIYVAQEGTERSIFSMGKDGSNVQNLTKGKGSFRNPVYSPASK